MDKLHITIQRNNDNDSVHNFTVEIKPGDDIYALPIFSKYVLKNTKESKAVNIMKFSTDSNDVRFNTDILFKSTYKKDGFKIHEKYTCVNTEGNDESIYFLHLCIVDKKKLIDRKKTDVPKYEVLMIYFKGKMRRTIERNNITSNVLLRKIAILVECKKIGDAKQWKKKGTAVVAECNGEYEEAADEEEMIIFDDENELIVFDDKEEEIVFDDEEEDNSEEKMTDKSIIENENETTTNEKDKKDTDECEHKNKKPSRLIKFTIAILVPLFLMILMISGIVAYKYHKIKKEEQKKFFELDMDYEMIEV